MSIKYHLAVKTAELENVELFEFDSKEELEEAIDALEKTFEGLNFHTMITQESRNADL